MVDEIIRKSTVDRIEIRFSFPSLDASRQETRDVKTEQSNTSDDVESEVEVQRPRETVRRAPSKDETAEVRSRQSTKRSKSLSNPCRNSTLINEMLLSVYSNDITVDSRAL